ncbi:TonB family protein [Mesorhizobium sp. KR2-14]|uniref:cell envelope integrity protein TolA n=1 Tax=Mesorhizobium sp. KR2-14 TaxID=3156610 RepID=UPI0032B5BC2C
MVESKAPPATSDSGPTKTVHSIPPSEQLSASRNLSEAPAATPEPPLVSESATPLEAPRSPAPPEVTTKSEAARPETPRKKTAPPPEEKTRGRANEREKATTAQRRNSRPALPAGGKADARAQASYMAGVASRLLARRYFPTGAPSGSVVVNFSIAPSGKLTSRKIARSSGSPILDKAALQIVERAAPFPPFPKGVTAPRLNFSVPMNFNRK